MPVINSQIAEGKAEHQTTNEFADHVLFGRDKKPFAVVEAKRTSRDPLVGERQALDVTVTLTVEEGQKVVYFQWIPGLDARLPLPTQAPLSVFDSTISRDAP